MDGSVSVGDGRRVPLDGASGCGGYEKGELYCSWGSIVELSR